MIPEEKTVDQPILILGVQVTIGLMEIKEILHNNDIHPKGIERFVVKGTENPSTTVHLYGRQYTT